MNPLKVIGFGAMNLDELYQVPNVLADHETTVEVHQLLPGGSAANTIYGLTKLGVSTGFIGAIGDDKAGESLRQDFEHIGVDISQIKTKMHAKSGLVLGLTDHQGNRALYVEPGANNLLTREDVSLEYIAKADIIHLSSFVDDQQFELQRWVSNNIPETVKISFTPGAIYTRKGMTALSPIIAKTHVLFTNESEIEELTEMTDFKAAARHFLREGCKIVVVTLGKGSIRKINTSQLTLFGFNNNVQVLSTGGYTARDNRPEPFRYASYVANSNNQYIIESKPVKKVDTTGAGDAFATGFLYGLLKEQALDECGRLGDIVAQFCISQLGARQGLPTATELAQRYRKLYNQQL